jgi:hypothetical protein
MKNGPFMESALPIMVSVLHVQIQLKEEFINSITEPSFSAMIDNQKGKEFILGIGQSYDIYIGNNEYRQNPNKHPFEGQLVYQDDKGSYCEPFLIDVEHYATIFSINSETEDMIKAIKDQTRVLERIKQELEK